MSIEQILTNAKAYTVVDDGQFKYPVLTADIPNGGKTFEELRVNRDAEVYGAWCQDVPMVSEVSVGSGECIELCEKLVEAGADEWFICNRG